MRAATISDESSVRQPDRVNPPHQHGRTDGAPLTHEEVQAALNHLAEKGVRVWSQDGTLRYRGPKGVLTTADLEHLRANRQPIVSFLERYPQVTPEDHPEFSGSLDEAPLSLAQLWRWHVCHLHSGYSSRTTACAVRIRERVIPSVFRAAVEQILRRHDSLRTRLRVVRGQPVQVVVGESPRQTGYHDLTAVASREREREAHRLIDLELRAVIDLSRDPMFRATLLKLDDRENVLVIATDHMISDATSLNLLLAEVLQTYDALSQEGPTRHTLKQAQYPAYCIWERRLQIPLTQSHGAYWDRCLDGWQACRFPPESSNEVATRGLAAHNFEITADVRSRLQQWASQHQTTLPLAVLTAYVALVARWCRISDPLIQFQTNGRSSESTREIVGYFASLLGMRIRIRADDSFLDLLEEVTSQFCDAAERGDHSYMAAQASRSRFVRNTVFNWVPSAADMAVASSSSHSYERLDLRAAGLDNITWDNDPEIVLIDTGEVIGGCLYFGSWRFSQESMQRFASNLSRYLEVLLSRPEQRLDALRTI